MANGCNDSYGHKAKLSTVNNNTCKHSTKSRHVVEIPYFLLPCQLYHAPLYLVTVTSFTRLSTNTFMSIYFHNINKHPNKIYVKVRHRCG